MGHLALSDFIKWAPSRRVALEWHFRSNCFPPIPYYLIPTAEVAISAMEANEPERLVKLPGVVELPSGTVEALEAQTIVRTLHLEAFLEPNYEEESNQCEP